MFRSAVFILAAAHAVLAAPGDTCASSPYNEMSQFSGYRPAQNFCAAHYPAHTTTVTADRGCLTTTRTSIISTTTVTVSRTQGCTYSPPPESESPVPTNKAKRQAAAVTPMLKRQDGGIRGRWSSYSAELAHCGADCIQTACSCVATTRTFTTTPRPTCTSTSSTATVYTRTVTDIGAAASGYSCGKSGSKKAALRGHHSGTKKEAMHGHHDGSRKAAGKGRGSHDGHRKDEKNNAGSSGIDGL